LAEAFLAAGLRGDLAATAFFGDFFGLATLFLAGAFDLALAGDLAIAFLAIVRIGM